MPYQTTHTKIITAECPRGGTDFYEVEFAVSNIVLQVESIDREIRAATEAPIFQEELTQILANRLACRVTTKGTHSGFATDCIAEPEPAPEFGNPEADGRGAFG